MTPTDYPDRVRALVADAEPISTAWALSVVPGWSDRYDLLEGAVLVAEIGYVRHADAALIAEAPTLARAYLDLHAEVERLRAEHDVAVRDAADAVEVLSGHLRDERASVASLRSKIERLTRVLAVECGDESAAPPGWWRRNPGHWQRRNLRVYRGAVSGVYQFQTTDDTPDPRLFQTALEAMEAADRAAVRADTSAPSLPAKNIELSEMYENNNTEKTL